MHHRGPWAERSVMKLKLILTTAVVVATAGLLGTTAASQAAPFVYVSNSGSGNVSQYDALGGGAFAALAVHRFRR
jgi:hypothetical protein